jgi:Transposase DDE domain group 1
MKYEIEETDEFITGRAGLALVGQLVAKTELANRIDGVELAQCKKPEIKHSENLISMVGLLCTGKPDYDAIEEYREDDFFADSLGIAHVPSSPTLRQRIDMAEGGFDGIILDESALLLKKAKVKLTPCHDNYLPLDIDVSCFDNSGTKKEGVSYTYKGFNGYSPVFAYLGEEGYLINAQLKEGKAHCQDGMPGFLRETIAYSRKATRLPILVRYDSGNDSADNIKVCIAESVDWLIKRNLHKENPEEWLFIATTTGKARRPRAGKTVYTGETHLEVKGFDAPLRVVFEVTKRDCDARGQMLLMPEIEVNTWWTSLPDKPDTVIELYHRHGTSEQFHSELKTDMDLERLPSGKFAANSLVLLCGLLAYNILRIIGQETISIGLAPTRKKVARRRIKSVFQDMIYMACRVAKHARRFKLKFSRGGAWFPTWKKLYLKFAAT